MDVIVDCLVCGSSQSELIHPGTFRGGAEDAPAYFLSSRTLSAHGNIRRCTSCGFVFTSPQFTPTEIDAIYAGIQHGVDYAEALATADALRFRRIARLVRRHVSPTGRFLDFGCGGGGFLRAMNDPNGVGFEIGAPGWRTAGPSCVVTGRWRDVAGKDALAKGSFDLVVAIDVLEHLPEIRADMEAVRDVLKPGGRLFITVPDYHSMIARLMGRRWSMILLEHLWYFTPQSLAAFLKPLGFDMLHVQGIPYDAPVEHIAKRAFQTFGLKPLRHLGPLGKLSLPVPAGVLAAAFVLR